MVIYNPSRVFTVLGQEGLRQFLIIYNKAGRRATEKIKNRDARYRNT
jgi:hypothetical protein